MTLYLSCGCKGNSGAGGKVRGWLNGIEIPRVSREIFSRTRAKVSIGVGKQWLYNHCFPLVV